MLSSDVISEAHDVVCLIPGEVDVDHLAQCLCWEVNGCPLWDSSVFCREMAQMVRVPPLITASHAPQILTCDSCGCRLNAGYLFLPAGTSGLPSPHLFLQVFIVHRPRMLVPARGVRSYTALFHCTHSPRADHYKAFRLTSVPLVTSQSFPCSVPALWHHKTARVMSPLLE